MSKRKVTLKVTSQKDLIHHESAARTFGELKKELPQIKWGGMRTIERTNKTTLQMDDAVLPSTDFILFLMPEKVKSGVFDVKNASYNELRSHASQLNKTKNADIKMSGGTEDLRKRVKKYYKNVESPVEAEAAEVDVQSIIEESRAKINDALDVILENIGSITAKTAQEIAEDTTQYLIKLSIEDLDDEFAEIKKELKL